jgi:hypothetical protein
MRAPKNEGLWQCCNMNPILPAKTLIRTAY